RALPDAARPSPADEYTGSPVFVYDRRNEFLRSRGAGHADTFDPAQPDGTLILRVAVSEGGFPSLADARASAKSIELVSRDGANVYVVPCSTPDSRLAVPSSYHRGELISLTIAGERMLPAEAIISQLGCIGWPTSI